jgi:hypothetical protein
VLNVAVSKLFGDDGDLRRWRACSRCVLQHLIAEGF